MNLPLSPRDEAQFEQGRGSDPAASAWVTASAGSGKTKVLTDRVLRLLLAPGTRPNAILCLTFTKAAAAEMATRLARDLGAWAVAPEAELAERLSKLLGRAPRREDLDAARRLFCRVLELPGGMRISTIHAFCQSLLRAFPLEAGLSPQFGVVEDAEAAALLADAREDVLAGSRTPREALDALASLVPPSAFAELVSTLTRDRDRLAAALRGAGSLDLLCGAVARHLGLGGAVQDQALLEGAVGAVEEGLVAAARLLQASRNANDRARGTSLLDWLALGATQRAARWNDWSSIFLTDKGKVRADLLDDLAMGRIDILIGTHAIFQDAVDYHDLGLVVVDEQHRFGVAQRLLLAAKAKAPPHLLAMTATPIPRSLQLTQYGEMDASQIDELPPGRQPIETRVTAIERLDEVVEALGRHLAVHGQAYWVCPLVEGSETGDEAAAELRATMLKARFGGGVGLVHGRMKPAEKDAVMVEFSAGRLLLLVATTVIEVGVDVPNATLMIIEAAERFGLAQLHQLRGRVGRGEGRSVCLLLRGPDLSDTAKARLKLMRETNDGFRIAEEDLRLRGAGEILGVRQSGEAAFRLADPERTAKFVAVARDDARLLLDRDGGLAGERGTAARVLLYLFERDAGVGMLRSG